MSTRTVSLSEMFGWFSEAIRMFKFGWRRFASASLWSVLIAVVPALLLVGMAFAAGYFPVPGQVDWIPTKDLTPLVIGYCILVLISLVLHPALTAGWFALCGDVDVGRGGRGRDVLSVFRHPALWGRALKVVLIVFCIGLVVFAVTLLPVIPGFIALQHATIAQHNATNGVAAGQIGLMLWFFLGYFVFLIATVFLQGIALIAIAEVTARPTAPVAALRLAARAVFRHVFKLFLLAIVAYALMNAMMVVVMLPMILLAVLAMLISPVLCVIVAILGYLLMIMVMYPVIFVFPYLAWKGMLTDAAPPAMVESALM